MKTIQKSEHLLLSQITFYTVFSMLFLLLYCAKSENDTIEHDKVFKEYHSLEFNISKDEIKLIDIDQRFFTVIFPFNEFVTFEALLEENEIRYSLGDIKLSNGRYGLHCVNKHCLFKCRSSVNTTAKMHILYDSLKCNRTFISQKINESFEISSSNAFKIKNGETICFFYIPSFLQQFILEKRGNIEVYYSTLKEQRILKSGENISVHGMTIPSFFFSVKASSEKPDENSYFLRFTSSTPNYMKNMSSNHQINQLQISYDLNDDIFFLHKIGKEEIDVQIPEIHENQIKEKEINNEKNYYDEYFDFYANFDENNDEEYDDDKESENNRQQVEIHSKNQYIQKKIEDKEFFEIVAKTFLIVSLLFMTVTTTITCYCMKIMKKKKEQELEPFLSNSPEKLYYFNDIPHT